MTFDDLEWEFFVAFYVRSLTDFDGDKERFKTVKREIVMIKKANKNP